MNTKSRAEKVASALLQTKGLTLTSCKVLQTLWAGYGHICSVRATSASGQSLYLILKYVSPPVKLGNQEDEGHVRKTISYQVEQYFYTHLAPRMSPEIGVAYCYASSGAHDGSENTTAMMLSDLRQDFPIPGERLSQLNKNQLTAAIDWLARFHGFWWTRVSTIPRETLRRPPLSEIERKPSGVTGSVWLNGGYSYLATRRSEYANLAEDSTSEWAQRLCVSLTPSETIAECVARFLSPVPDGDSEISSYATLIHGDVKSENLFTTTQGDKVAFYDFQYVGLGLGVCDLAKLFTCSVPGNMLGDGARDGLMHTDEEGLLRRYLRTLKDASGKHYDWEVFVRHWEVAIVDWLRFQASWGFWGNTDWLEERTKTILDDTSWRQWLEKACHAS